MSNSATLTGNKTRRVSEAVVLAEPRPDFTATWHPFSHGMILETVGSAVAEAGFAIERKEYSIKPGAEMFAVWEVNRQDKRGELRFAIGIRNSINKKMAVGLCAGERVFVCDNMIFSSDFVLFRKHTGLLDADELTLMARDAFAAVTQKWDSLYAWHESMKEIEISTAQASLLCAAAMRRGIIPPSQYLRWDRLFYGDCDAGEKSKYTPTLHGWHGATTELMNDDNWNMNMDKQRWLNPFIDHEVPMLLAASAEKKILHVRLDQREERRERGAGPREEERRSAGAGGRSAREGRRDAAREARSGEGREARREAAEARY